ncbi:MAG TPA: Fe-S cluster assembly protein SufD [Pyrinomonadaceae bacterium]|nr:Fe-S cluster assembly protein SufD [Pyrinomonadaceae bacterium]
MATELLKQEGSYLEALREWHSAQPTSGVDWLDRLRSIAMERFSELGFPSVKDEEWKYTNVAPIARMNLQSRPPAAVLDVSEFAVPEAGESQLVFLNGKLQSEQSSLASLADGVIAVDLIGACSGERGTLVREHLSRSADYVSNGFTALNTGFISDGVFIHIPRNAAASQPIHLLFVSDGAQPVTFPRVLIVAEENSSATIIESYLGAAGAEYFTNAVVEIVLKDGARLEHYKVQREGADAFHVATTVAELGVNASYDTTTINFGGKLSRHDVRVVMDHEGAECWVDGLYLVTDNQHTDTHSVIDHRQPHCTSHQLYKGILDGKSRAVFNGKVFVRHGAQKTDAMQTNKNLLLSNEARVDTKPQLEILADDVKCAHGAAVGQIDEEELFYLETRGIHPDLGRNLLTYGFAEEVINKIKVDSIKQQLDKAVLNRLNTRLEV